MLNKTVIILRGVPGNGKSTLASLLATISTLANLKCEICCADDYFMDQDGAYKYDPEKIGGAHLWCQRKFHDALFNNVDLVIVANTSTRERDVNHYRKQAIEFDYKVFVLLVENWHQGIDLHNVPENVKQSMKEQLMNSIKLL